MKFRKFFILFISISVALISCIKKENRETGNIKVSDAEGNEIILHKPAERVVVLFEPLLDGIYMLGAEETLVGVSAKLYSNEDTYDYLSLIDERIKNKSISTPGDEESLNIESVIGLKPDLVIGYKIADGTVKTLKQMGISVYNGKSETYADTEKELTDLGNLLGKEQRSKEILDFVSAEFEKIKQQTEGLQKKTAYFSWANGRIFATAGTESMMGQCLDFAGVKNVVQSKIDIPNINPETLISWNPDMIYMWDDSPDLFYNHIQLANVSAVKNKQIYNLMPMFFYNPHNLKALMTSLRIQNWAYRIKSEEKISEQMKAYIIALYGEKRGEVLSQAFKEYGN